MIKSLSNNRSRLFLLLILLLSILVVWPLFRSGYFSHHDDIQVMRIVEMRKCFSDFQIPCRWVPDMGYGNGFPLFNYYPVLPYYLGAVLSFFLGYIGAAKVLFFIPLVLGGVFMYLLGREVFDEKAGLVAGVLFLFAPYRAVDSYIRGAVAESFAIALMPLVLYFSLKLIKKRKTEYFVGLALSLAAFLTSHTIMTIFFLPVLAVWLGYWLLEVKVKKRLSVFLSLILGFGISAFYTLPAFIERGLVQEEALTRLDLDFRSHFATIRQLFIDRTWGFGSSIYGPVDHMSFQIGWPHWWLVLVLLFLISLVVVLYFAKVSSKKVPGIILYMHSQLGNRFFLTLFLLAGFFISIGMTHARSIFIWERIDLLKYAQFPWRFLSLTIVFSSLLGGLFIYFFRGRWQVLLAAGVIVATPLLNYSYFKPDIQFPMTNEEITTGELWEEQQKASILDYLPVTAVEPKEPASSEPMVTGGEADIGDFINRSNHWQFQASVAESATVELPVFDFPYWQVEVNGEKVTHSNDNYVGRISLGLPSGEHEVKGYFRNTPIRTFANLFSLVSILSLLLVALNEKTKKYLSQ